MTVKLQQKVNKDLAMGLPGSVAYDSPIRAQTGIIGYIAAQTDNTKNCFGRVFTRKTGTDTWRVGCATQDAEVTTIFDGEVGILINPKESVAFKLDQDPFLRFGSTGTFATMGQFFVTSSSKTAIKFNSTVGFVQLTGEIGTDLDYEKKGDPAVDQTTNFPLLNAKVVKYEFEAVGTSTAPKRDQNQVFVLQLT